MGVTSEFYTPFWGADGSYLWKGEDKKLEGKHVREDKENREGGGRDGYVQNTLHTCVKF